MDLKARHNIHRKVRKREFARLVVGAENNDAFGCNGVTGHLEVAQLNPALGCFHRIELYARLHTRWFAIRHCIQRQLGLRQIGIETRLIFTLCIRPDCNFDGYVTCDEIIDIKSELGTISIVELQIQT